MSEMASQITSLTTVYSTMYSDAYQRKYQSSASLAYVRGIHWWPVNSPHKGPVTRKRFPFDDVIMFIMIDDCSRNDSQQICGNFSPIWNACSVSNKIGIRTFDLRMPNLQMIDIGFTASEGKKMIMMTSSNGNIFRVTGPQCVEFTGPRWIPLTKASDAELRCFIWSAPE